MISMDPLLYIKALAVENAVTISLNIARHDPGCILKGHER
jgi:hypothetical protein